MCGATQEDFARLLGVTRLTYIHKENGVRTFSNAEQELIIKEINKKMPEITIDEIFFDE